MCTLCKRCNPSVSVMQIDSVRFVIELIESLTRLPQTAILQSQPLPYLMYTYYINYTIRRAQLQRSRLAAEATYTPGTAWV